jgi:ADP-ribose pyrophosphatase
MELFDLPGLPGHSFSLVEERPSLDPPGFLRLRRLVLRVRYADGTLSEPFEYDAIGRSRLDAVVVAAHYRRGGRRLVVLRSALRPPVALRACLDGAASGPKPRARSAGPCLDGAASGPKPRARSAGPCLDGAASDPSPVPERLLSPGLGGLWELPAGLVEDDERSREGLRRCAARELHEEVGIAVDPAALLPLGPSGFPAPGIIGERHFFFHVEIDPAQIRVPLEDGSALERQARIAAVGLDEALALTRAGVIEDEKTELALRRLAEIV